MSNVNYFPQNTVVKQDQPVNSHYIQKILDENVSLIHTIIEKQQQHHTQESDELLKNLHKNLIYLATIADQTTSAGNQTANVAPSNQYNYNGQVPQVSVTNPPYHNNIPVQQQAHQVPQTFMVPVNEIVEKKLQSSEEDSGKDLGSKADLNSSYGVDTDKDVEKAPLVKECVNQSPMSNKSVDMDRECPPNIHINEPPRDMLPLKQGNMNEVMNKSEDTMFGQNQISNIKTDMPPPSQLPLGVHPTEKAPSHYPPANQRFGYPTNFGQYGPHYDQNNKFYPQNAFPPPQQSPYNYQAMYGNYQAGPPPPGAMGPGHYNPGHMVTGGYPQYQYYQGPGPMDPSVHGPPPTKAPDTQAPSSGQSE